MADASGRCRYAGNQACVRRLMRRAAGVFLWGLLTVRAVFAQDAVTVAAEPQSRFVRTVVSVQDAAPQVRGDFAVAALSHLADAYAAETRLARHGEQSRGWSATVDRYAGQIELLLDDVELGLPVLLTLEADNSLAISVGARTVIVSHPRPSQQGALEQGILKDFCSRQDCGGIQPHPSALEPISGPGVSLKPTWSFTEQGTACTYEGITVRFSSGQNTAHARVICEQFLLEVLMLADALTDQRRHAVDIQWDLLALQAVPGSTEQTVQLNALGDSVVVTAPLLAANAALLRQVLPWLRQWLESGVPSSIEIDAAAYGWQKP